MFIAIIADNSKRLTGGGHEEKKPGRNRNPQHVDGFSDLVFRVDRISGCQSGSR